MSDVRVLVVSKGHDYNHDSFIGMFDAMEGITMTLVEQPAAQVILQPENVADYDVVFFYDMSGIPGVGLLHDGADDTGIPPAAYVHAIESLMAQGKGMILVNHATVGWPDWPLWRELTKTSFMLKAGELNGKQVPGSGYRGGHGPLPSATVQLVPQADHPVLEGLPDGLEITDELYLKTREFEDRVVPLLRADYSFTADNFTPPPLAPAEEQSNWDHPQGSDLIVWAHAAGNAPVVVSDVGDGPLAYDNPDYRRLIANAIRWTASAEARTWAKQQAARR